MRVLTAVARHLAPAAAAPTAAVAAPQQQPEPSTIFNYPPESTFDRTQFEADGFFVWPGIVTEAARARYTAALQRLQELTDSIIRD
eukprot:COSAG04_NODE_1821_length_5499_cov_33.155000_1_plen_85_part_10